MAWNGGVAGGVSGYTNRAGYASGQMSGWRFRRNRKRVWSFKPRRAYWFNIRRSCWVKISSFAGGAALLANVVGVGGLAGTGGELIYGKEPVPLYV